MPKSNGTRYIILVMKWSDEENVVGRANNASYGLGESV